MQYNKSVEVITKLPWYTEGPVVDELGNVYVTTLKGGCVLKIDTNYNVTEWAKSPCPNGQLILPDGDHLICDSLLSTISRFDKDGKFIRHEIEAYCGGEKITSPNDLVADSKGRIYFTDSIRQKGKVCYYEPGGSQGVIATGLDFPNGIEISADEKTLFVAESYKNRILAFNLPAKSSYVVFANLPVHSSGEIIKNLPDGIKKDRNGNLLVAHYGMNAVQVLSAQGKLIHSISTEFSLPSNLFIDGNVIFITGGYDEPQPGGLIKLVLE